MLIRQRALILIRNKLKLLLTLKQVSIYMSNEYKKVSYFSEDFGVLEVELWGWEWQVGFAECPGMRRDRWENPGGRLAADRLGILVH